MRQRIFVTLAIAFCFGVGIQDARAQIGTLGQPPARQRPTISPYINLGDGGGAFSYYGLVKPQTDALRSFQELQQGMNLLNPDGSAKGPLQQNPAAAQTGLQTGHAATFFNYGQYYPQNPYQGTASANGVPLGNGLGGYGPGANQPGVGGGYGGYGGYGGAGVPVFFGGAFNPGGGTFRR